jgi:translation initiation factor 2-alpha kinase 4
VGPLDEPDYFTRLIFEFPPEYPKVPVKINITWIQPEEPDIRKHIEHIVETHPLLHQGREAVFDIIATIQEYLSKFAEARAKAKQGVSLEEERALREAMAQKRKEEQRTLTRKQQTEEADEKDDLIATQVESEKQRRMKTTLTRKPTGEETADLYDDPEEPIHFDQSMLSHDVATGTPFKFKSVVGRTVIVKRRDKRVTIVAPRVDTNRVQAPQLLLKDIYLPESIAPKADMTKWMEDIEQLLISSKEHRHENVVDLLNYKIEHLVLENGSGQWNLAILSEYANKGSLYDLLEVAGTLSADKIRAWTRQLVDALLFFERQGYVHPAVHAENILLFLSSTGGLTVKLSDGYGTQLRDLVQKARDPKAAPTNDSPLWLAPELTVTPPKRTKQTCLFDLGKVIVQMALGNRYQENYPSPRDLFARNEFESSADNLLQSVFRPYPNTRPTVFDLSQKQFFREDEQGLFRTTSLHQHSTPFRSRRFSNKSNTSRFASEWEVLDKLGRGGFGEVFRARRKLDGQIYAVKVIQASKTSEALEDMLREVSLLAKLNHPYVVRYYNAWIEHEDDEEDDDTEESTSEQTPSRRSILQRSIQPSGAISHGHDFMEPSDARNQGAEFDSDNDPFGYQTLSEDSDDESNDENDNDDQDNDDDDNDNTNDDDDDDPFGYQEPPSVHDDDDLGDDFFESVPDASMQQDVDITPPDQARRRRPSRAASTDQESSIPQAVIPFRKPTRPGKSTLYIQMELCDKQTLKSRIDQRLGDDIDAAWRLLRRILEGLAHIHSNGIVHRDLKPANVFLDAHDFPRIGDFGLATTGQATSRHQQGNVGMTIQESTGVGTQFYMAPEIKQRGSKYDARVDMYALGIMFFEMCYPMTAGLVTSMEKAQAVQNLRNENPSLPDFFNDELHKKQGEMILQLVQHDFTKRPQAAELLASGLIPEPMEDEKVQRYVARVAAENPEEYQAWIAKLFSHQNNIVQNLAWEDKSTSGLSHVESMLWLSMSEHVKLIFRRHGAIEIHRQGIIPMADFYGNAANAATYLDTSGLVVQLPRDLTLPHARSLGQKQCPYTKSYCFGFVYRTKGPKEQERPKGQEPRQIPQIAFDFISHSAKDLAMKEAEVIKVLDEMITEIPALKMRSWTIYLNHGDLLDSILEHCRIRPEDSLNVKQILSHLNIEAWTQIRERLRSMEINISNTCVNDLSNFNFAESLDVVRAKLTKLFGEGDRLSKALTQLARLEELVSIIHRMNVQADIRIAPLHNYEEYLYRGSIMFQCIETSTQRVLAVGGRYDALIDDYKSKSEKGTIRAVDVRVNAGVLVAYMRSQVRTLTSSSRVAKAPAVDPKVAAALTRCDILVAGFDPTTRATSCVDLVSSLWAAGFSAELSEEARSLEELELAYKDNMGYWVVMVRGGPAERLLKVRSPSKEEEEVRSVDLVAFLRRRMGRK